MSPGRPWRREKSPKENPMDGLEQSSPALPEELDALRARVAMLEQGEALQEILRTAALSRDVGVALVQDMPLQHSLQQIAQALVHHLDAAFARIRSEEHTSELQSRQYLVCRLLLEKKKK